MKSFCLHHTWWAWRCSTFTFTLLSCPHLRTAICQRFMCISAIIEVITIWTSAYIFFKFYIIFRGVGRESCYAGSSLSLNKWFLSFLQKTENDAAVLKLVGSSFHHWGTKTEKSCDFTEWALFALSDGGTGWPADVEERSALAGACDLTCVPVRCCRVQNCRIGPQQWCWGCRTVCRRGLLWGFLLLMKVIPQCPWQWLTGPCKSSLSPGWRGVKFY